MKTTYNTPEDEYWLEKILHRAIMSTDDLLGEAYANYPDPEIKEYIQTCILPLRAKAFDFLNLPDFNQHILDYIKKRDNHDDRRTETAGT